MNAIYKPNGTRRLRSYEIARWLGLETYEYDLARVSGEHCNCGADKGEFELLPKTHEAVIEGGKAYMFCRNCGCYSHL